MNLEGRIPAMLVEADTLAEGFHKAVLACLENGVRIETPKQREGVPLGYDAHITVNVLHPDKEPKLHKAGFVEDDRGLMQYILEVTHGIHNHWKRDPNNPNDTRWGYTYNERFVEQIPFMLAKIKKDFQGKGRISGRDYFFSTWRPREDSILEQEDPPCFQNGQVRFVKGDDGIYHMNYLTCWRSRDELKAWNENNLAQVELQELLVKKISDLLGIEIRIGSYIDTSTSLHIYGAYLKEYANKLERMKTDDPKKYYLNSNNYIGDRTKLKRIIAAQIDAEDKGHGINQSIPHLVELGYDLETLPYPKDWDSWPKEWDRELDKSRL